MADAESKPIDLENIDYDGIAQGVDMVGEDMGGPGVVDARHKAWQQRTGNPPISPGKAGGAPDTDVQTVAWSNEREAAYVADRAQRSDRTRRIVEDVFRRPPAGDSLRTR